MLRDPGDRKIPGPTVRAQPLRTELPAGTELWRVHSVRRTSTEFRTDPVDLHWGGGRFCYIRDELSPRPVPYIYVGLSPLTAVSETLARDLVFHDDGRRRISYTRVKDQLLSKVVTARDLPLVDLRGPAELAAVRQTAWLIRSDADNYQRTRRWASWIRGQARWSVGFRWPSRQDFGPEGADSCILYEPDNAPPLLEPSPEPPLELHTPAGRAYLNDLLKPWGIRVDRR